MLKVFKNDGTWDFIETVFKITCATFQQPVTKFLKMFGGWWSNWSVLNQKLKKSMEYLHNNNIWLTYHKYARHATEVIFHRSLRLRGIVPEIRHYYGSRRSLYGLKTKVSVLPSGFTIGCSVRHPILVLDIEVFAQILIVIYL